jgi:1,2-phenylacetyl-CoA epoxidase catalytic subunit
MLRAQAHREAAAAGLFERGRALAPTAADARRLEAQAAEERRHLAAAGGAWSALTGEPAAALVTWAEAHAATHPLPEPTSWLELSIAQLLFDRAGYHQLREYADSAWQPHRELVGPILAEEAEHQRDGADEVLATMARATDEERAAAQAAFVRWLRVSLLSFGRPGTAASAEAIALGLKRRDPAKVMRDFLDDVRAIATRVGVPIATPGELGLEG